MQLCMYLKLNQLTLNAEVDCCSWKDAELLGDLQQLLPLRPLLVAVVDVDDVDLVIFLLQYTTPVVVPVCISNNTRRIISPCLYI